MGFARCCHPAIVFRSQPSRSDASALVSHHCRCRHAMLLDEIFGQGERSGQALSATGRAVLWKVWRGFQSEAGGFDQVSKGNQ